jgi:hypothetical protein
MSASTHPSIVEEDTNELTEVDLDNEVVHDIADEENNPVLDAFDEFEELAAEMLLSSEQAFMLYAKNIAPDYQQVEDAISKFISKQDFNVIVSVISAMKEAKKVKASSSPPEEVKKTKTLIKIKKGLQEHEIKEYIKEIDVALTKDKTDVVDIYCVDWADGKTHPCLIPACKKLLVKYCEAGLLGCLVNHDYQKVAHELYCYAYMKGKLIEDKIQFQNVDINDYKIKVSESVKTFWMLIDGVKTQATGDGK